MDWTVYRYVRIPVFGSSRCVHSATLIPLPIDWYFVAKPSTQLVARQREQHRYFNARQTRRKLPIRTLQH